MTDINVTMTPVIVQVSENTYTINMSSVGAQGATGAGVPTGGTTNQVLTKIDGTNYNTKWSDPAAGGVTSVTGSAPIAVTTGATPNVTIASASTSVAGAVQLSDSVSTTDSTKAATSTAVKSANDNANNKVASVSGTLPISVSTGTTPTVSIAAASTTVAGAVQLTDSTSSTSTTTAATPNSVKSAYDLASTANTAAGNAQTTANAKVASVSGTLPISVTTGTTPTVSIAAASTTVAGAVQLTDSTSSTSTTTAATPNSVKTIADSDALKAPLASPALTGTPTTTTAAVDTNTTQIASTAFVLAQAGSATPIGDGTATVGTSTRFARQDHVHPTDTSRASAASPTLSGTVTLSGLSTGVVHAGSGGALTSSGIVDADIATAGLAQLSLNGVVIADWAASTTYAKGDLVNYLGVAYRRIAAGTSGLFFVVTMWQQVTPALSAVAANITGIPNGATTATSANTPSTIVARDGSGNFSAGTITPTTQLAANTTSTAVPAVVVAPKGSFTLTGVSASHTGSNAYNTITVSSTVGLYVGQSVTLASLSADFNGTAVVQQITNATSLRVDSALSGSYSASGGTLTASGTQQNLQEWQRTDGTVLTSINPAGGIVTPLGTGVVHQTAGGAFTSSLVTDSDVDSSASIASSKLSTQRSPSSPVGSIEPIPRYFATASTGARNNGYIPFVGFYADKTYSISTSSTALFGGAVAAVAGSGSGFITRLVLISVSGGTYSVIARTGNVTSYYASGSTTTTTLPTAGLLSVANVIYTGTFDGTATLTEGSFYMIGVLQYASTLGTATFASLASTNLNSSGLSAAGNPGLLVGQYQPVTAADVTTSTTFTSPSVTAPAIWTRITV